MMIKKILFGAMGLIGLGVCSVGWSDYRLNDPYPEAKTSFYSERLLKLLEHWPPPTLLLHDARPVYVRAIKTPGFSDMVGVVKHFTVKAPLSKVVELTEKFDAYPKIWDDIVSVQVDSRDKNRTVTSWVRKAPAFFLPRIKFRTLYISDKSHPDRVVYFQRFLDGNAMKSSDGLVVMEKVTDQTTRISVITFFNPDAGAFRGLVEGKIWKKSVENAFKDDIAFAARLEHPDWSLDQVTEAAEKALDAHPIDEVEYTDLIHFEP
jgi:uncharacterized membrane protein